MSPQFELTLSTIKVAVIGLGYIGLPLAIELEKRYPTLGFDIDHTRIAALRSNEDSTCEIESADLAATKQLTFTSDLEDLKECNVYIVAVPTPIDKFRQPNLAPLLQATELIGQVLNPGDLVIYESTVYPGATEEDCVPVIERVSDLTFNIGFFVGYSPERVNPGDKQRPLRKIRKVTSGSTPEVATFVSTLYDSILEAGVFQASSIRVAEASKIIENTQRDVNIALINEFSILCSHLGIDTMEVIEAAATKWNFVKLQPGLVGGHCIGVDPYYLVHKSMSVGYVPDIIRLSREINDGMARNITERLVRAMVHKELAIKGARVLVLGITFKENCPDIRNTKVVDLIAQLQGYGIQVDVCDTRADPDVVQHEHGLRLLTELPEKEDYDVVILATPHQELVAKGVAALRNLHREGGIFFDVKAAFTRAESDLRL